MFLLFIYCYNVKNINKVLYWDFCKLSVFGLFFVVMVIVVEFDLIFSVLMIGFVMIRILL